MEISFDDIYYRAEQKHLEGAHERAFAQIKPLIVYPGMMVTDEQWKVAWELVGGIAGGMGKERLSHLAMQAALQNQDAKVLYSLGYELNEQELPHMAATALNEAHLLAPTNEAILSELAVAFENAGMFDLAYLYLSGSISFVSEASICRYSLAFNALMCGEIEEAKKVVEEHCRLRGQGQHGYAWERIQRILARLDAVGGELQQNQLREWHYVLTGGILLHRSLHGSEELMKGQHQFFRDSSLVIRKAIERLRACLHTWGSAPQKVYFYPDGKSEILGRAFAHIEGIEAHAWSEEVSDEPGLFVTYDLRTTSAGFARGFAKRQKGQYLWAHMLCWVEDFPLTADFHTLMFQHEEVLGGISESANTKGELEKILNTPYKENPYDLLEGYLSFIQQIGPFPEVGVRERYFQGNHMGTRRLG